MFYIDLPLQTNPCRVQTQLNELTDKIKTENNKKIVILTLSIWCAWRHGRCRRPLLLNERSVDWMGAIDEDDYLERQKIAYPDRHLGGTKRSSDVRVKLSRSSTTFCSPHLSFQVCARRHYFQQPFTSLKSLRSPIITDHASLSFKPYTNTKVTP